MAMNVIERLLTKFILIGLTIIVRQNKAIQDRIISGSRFIICRERRGTEWIGSGQSTAPSNTWKTI